jgi:death on curing protein
VKLHDAIVQAWGGESGVLQAGLLESIIERPRTVILGQEQYEGMIRKASSLGYSITTWHPFIDGNKRTALLSMGMFLTLNDVQMADAMDSLKYLLLLANEKIDEERFHHEVSKWCSKSRIGGFLKALQYETWPKLQMRVFRAVGYRLGFAPYRRRQLEWLAAGDVVTLDRVLEEHKRFEAAGYPKPFQLNFDDTDFIEE